jgi:hypothetical protein
VKSADARRLVADLELGDAIAKLIAGATPLSASQLEVLRFVFRPKKEGGPTRGRQPANTDNPAHPHDRSRHG